MLRKNKTFLMICALLNLFVGPFLAASESKLDLIDLKGSPVAGYLHIPRDRSIDNSTYLYVKYALESFREAQVRFVLLDLNTPGGEVFAALRIAEELKKMDSEYHIPVVAFVDNWALSAGALLAYSCRFIGTVSEGSMGAAEPVTVSSDGKMETASEKMVSALRVEFAKAAEFYGRNPFIAEAMVDKDVALVFRNHEIVKLVDNTQIIKEGENPDLVINAQGKLLTLSAKQMQEFKVSDFVVPDLLQGGQEKIRQEPFFQEAEIRWLSYHNWKIDFFAFLSHPFVASLLMMGLMIGLYGEIQHPGFGFSAALGLACLSLVLLSAFSTQLIGSLEIIIFLMGLILVVIDLFFIAGFGFVGVLGIFLFLAGLVAMLLPPLQGFSWNPSEWGIQMSEWVYRLTLFLSVIFIFFAVVLPLSSFFFRRSAPFQRLVLQTPEESIGDPEILPELEAKGITFSALRPFGKVSIDDTLYEAETEGEFISPGSNIVVIAHQGKRVIVKEGAL